jgi:hypothetical protein
LVDARIQFSALTVFTYDKWETFLIFHVSTVGPGQGINESLQGVTGVAPIILVEIFNADVAKNDIFVVVVVVVIFVVGLAVGYFFSHLDVLSAFYVCLHLLVFEGAFIFIILIIRSIADVARHCEYI